jgi:mannose-6-phosphate isomerase-like protein (cupin superfamily)
LVHNVIKAGDIAPSPGSTAKFEGDDYGSEVSFFLVDGEPGGGPSLHTHPYTETWIVQSGTARFNADGEEMDAGPGDILVVGAETPHKFTVTGTERLRMVCIHAAPRMVQVNLE